MCLSHLISTVQPCLIRTAMPCACSDHPVLLKSMAQHGRRETACGLPARLWLLLATTRSYMKEAYQSQMLMTVKSGCNTLQKGRSLKLLNLQFGYFWLPCGLSQRTRHCQSMAGAQRGRCELTAQHAVCVSALRVCSTSQINIFGHTAKSQSAVGVFCLVILVASVQGKSLVDQSL